ncbi:MAG TPA: sulfatase, partial [Arenibacter sp.]|nr:sulfatase [Arenibacter sp.]
MLLSTMMFSCRENSEIGSSNKKPRNILFVFTDDQRMSAIGALGNSEIKTPNMDKLVKKGMAFTNTNIMGSFSGAVCAPSRAMLMTGRPLFEIDPSGSIID